MIRRNRRFLPCPNASNRRYNDGVIFIIRIDAGRRAVLYVGPPNTTITGIPIVHVSDKVAFRRAQTFGHVRVNSPIFTRVDRTLFVDNSR